ncbi:MAG: hypothetical protein LBJ00_04050, partial [Planctomycetaceae bacterium]|nr:hypothetical protein [Planctomycetaceae bacterium]
AMLLNVFILALICSITTRLPASSLLNAQLVFDRQLGRFTTFLMQNIVFPLKNRQHFLNMSGLTPCNRLKRTVCASPVLFLVSMTSIIAFQGS